MDLNKLAGDMKKIILETELTESDIDIVKIVSIDKNNLSEVCIQHPKLYAFWNSMHKIAEDQVRRKEFELEKLEVVLDKSIRDDWAEAKAPTETFLKKAILRDDDYQNLKSELLDKKEEAGMIKAFVSALEQRKDMLWTLTATERKEMEAGLSIKGEIVKDHFHNQQQEED